jgi:hypothetical protein
MERLAYEIVSEAVQNPEIMAAKGDEIIERAMSQAFSGGGPDMNYEIDGEAQALLHELRTNPQRAEQFVSLAENMTRRLGSAAIEGVTQEMEATSDDREDGEEDTSTPASGLDEIAWPDSDTEPTPEPQTSGGPGALDDLQQTDERTRAEAHSASVKDATNESEDHGQATDREETGEQHSADAATSDVEDMGLTPTEGRPSPEEIAEQL